MVCDECEGSRLRKSPAFRLVLDFDGIQLNPVPSWLGWRLICIEMERITVCAVLSGAVASCVVDDATRCQRLRTLTVGCIRYHMYGSMQVCTADVVDHTVHLAYAAMVVVQSLCA